MKTTVEDIIKQIPDFEEFLNLAQEIRELSLKKLLLEAQIKDKESEIYRTANTDEKYFSNGKPPSVSFVKSAYEYSGFNGELLSARDEMARVTVDLDYKKLTMDIYKNMLDTWRTLSANERGATFS